ncbi:hypothetical protein EPUL_000212 [Erysiphe pulchra]|uniref:Uncharacterized protein n=1 Tax=Erysiphe pulchra TaxID=225359 RepID=A0A2S4Q1K4_9PEZI|nr:hypothetical protein EPUL_000212 [Erysiphe pulchra]
MGTYNPTSLSERRFRKLFGPFPKRSAVDLIACVIYDAKATMRSNKVMAMTTLNVQDAFDAAYFILDITLQTLVVHAQFCGCKASPALLAAYSNADGSFMFDDSATNFFLPEALTALFLFRAQEERQINIINIIGSMPRPKRSKATPSITSPRIRKSKVKESTDVASVTSRSSFNDLYDVSDNEDERRLSFMHNGKGKEKNEEALVSPLAQAFLEMEREQYTNIKKRFKAHSEKISVTEARSNSLLSSPTFEIGRKEEPTPTRESLALAMGNLRTQNNSVDLDFFEIDSGNQNRPDESTDLDPNMGTKTRKFRRSVRQADIQAFPNLLTVNTQHNLDHGTEFSFDVSTPIKTSNDTTLDSSISTSSSKSKKRKLSEVQVPQSSLEVSPPILVELDDIVPSTNPDNRDIHEYIEERKEDMLPSVENRSPTPQNIRDIMAPPHSSSSILSSPVTLSKPIRASSRNLRSLRVKTPPIRIDSDSEISSPPSLTHSPDLLSPTTIKSRDKKPKSSHISMSTAQLKALLPRRRRRIARDVSEGINSDDEINISGLASDEDELSHLIMGPQTRSRNTKSLNDPTVRASMLGKKPISMSNVKTSTLKTYGSTDNSSHSDVLEENEDNNNNKSTIRNIENINDKPQEIGRKLLGKELMKAVQKFKEVDSWALDFEDATSSSLSPIDAR